jgi:hypothetical protein
MLHIITFTSITNYVVYQAIFTLCLLELKIKIIGNAEKVSKNAIQKLRTFGFSPGSSTILGGDKTTLVVDNDFEHSRQTPELFLFLSFSEPS